MTHLPAVVPSVKMDGRELWVGICSCGIYQGAPTTQQRALKDAQQHADAKNGAE